MSATDKLGKDDGSDKAMPRVGACPAFGCGPLSVIKTLAEVTRLRCVRCGWGGALESLIA